jgi:hypothetical protein
MKFGKSVGAAAMAALLATSAVAPAQNFNGTSFEINRERVKLGTIKTCAKNAVYLIPTTYLYVTIRNSLSAGGGLGAAKAKARVYIEGLRKSELQGLAASVQNEIIAQLRTAGYKVLTYDDVKGDVADKERMKTNPRYGIATHDSRTFPGMDFAVATPTDEQTLDYGLMGPQSNFGKAAQRTGATLLLPEIYITLPQLGAQANKTQTLTWRSSSASISFDPAMHMAGANVYGATAKGGWCTILVPEHGQRVPALVAGEFKELSVSEEKYGDDWSTKRGDYSFVVDNAAFDAGVVTVGKTLARLVVDSMNGGK